MNSSWNKDWLEVQKQYMDALTSLGKSAAQQQSTNKQTPQWQKALEQLWQNKIVKMPGDPQAIFSDLLQHSNSWQSLSEQFNDLLNAVSAGNENNADWQAALNEQIQLMKNRMLNGYTNTGGNIWQAGMQTPMDSWQKLSSSLFSATDATTAKFPFANMEGGFEKLFSFPGLQTNRVVQEQMQEGVKLWQTYQSNYQTYCEALNKIDLNSLDKLQEKFITFANQGKSISSLRDLYDLWVDSQEEAYSQHVLTEEYSKLYGQLINSLMRFKAHSQHFFSETSKAMNLLTTDQQETLLQELCNVKRQQEEDKKRIKSLEEKITKLNKEFLTKANSSTVKKKKTRRKKVSSKKTSSQSGNTNK